MRLAIGRVGDSINRAGRDVARVAAVGTVLEYDPLVRGVLGKEYHDPVVGLRKGLRSIYGGEHHHSNVVGGRVKAHLPRIGVVALQVGLVLLVALVGDDERVVHAVAVHVQEHDAHRVLERSRGILELLVPEPTEGVLAEVVKSRVGRIAKVDSVGRQVVGDHDNVHRRVLLVVPECDHVEHIGLFVAQKLGWKVPARVAWIAAHNVDAVLGADGHVLDAVAVDV